MARSLGANGRPTSLLARASLLGLVAGGAIACQGDGSVEAARAEIRGGSPPDVELNEDGVVDLTDPAQWARDASVKLFNGETGCSGTLVSPRVVLTAAHCVWEIPDVYFSPRDGNGSVGDDLGAPEQVLAAVTHCMIHPEGEGTCGDGIDRAPLSRDYDLAVLVLADRFDTSPTSLYPVTHARIVEEDPSGPLGHEAQEWLGTPVRFAGYGQLGWEDSRISRVRLHAESRISAVYPRTFWAHDFGTIPGSVAFFGDSGGGVFAGNAESDTPFIDDGRPLQILGVHYASDPSSNYAVLLTASATQNFIEGFLGPVAEHYAGAMVEVSPTQWVWTGAPDVPRAGAPERTAAHDAADPDGDGFVGLHDNCWGHFNPRQAVSDEGFAGTCFTVPLRERRTYGCAARPAVVDEFTPEGTNDADADRVPDVCDNCALPNPAQYDCDVDGIGDACEVSSDDGDLIPDECDNCDDVDNFDQADCNFDAVSAANRSRARFWHGALAPPRRRV